MDTAPLEAILKPVSEASPCGDDLEYDADFTALEAAARHKAEQQFGDSVIPAVPPEWRAVKTQALDLLHRTKDVRVLVLLLRALTRLDGIGGFVHGIKALLAALESFWDAIHPLLDADDNNDPTMRLNALAPLTDTEMLLRDLHDARLASSRSVGTLLVRDVEVALGKLTARDDDTTYGQAQIDGVLAEVFAAEPELREACCGAADCVTQLQNALNQRLGSAHSVDFKPLREVAMVVQQLARRIAQSSTEGATDDSASGAEPGVDAPSGAPARVGARGEIASRQDAVNTLNRVITYLEQSEPGNPAPLLIKRAQRLIGVSFLDIMADLAPDALSSIENITGRSS